MRLIDADALFEELNNKQIPWNRRINDIIMEQPTAYDVEKVVDRMEVLFKHHNATKTVKRLVIETVREGGKE